MDIRDLVQRLRFWNVIMKIGDILSDHGFGYGLFNMADDKFNDNLKLVWMYMDQKSFDSFYKNLKYIV